MRKNKVRLPVKLFAIILIAIVAIGFIGGYLLRVLSSLKYFQVKDIFIKEASDIDLSHLKGRNIFRINLKNEASSVLESYPDYSQVNFIRILPDRLFVYFIRRTPVALVKLYKYFALDEQGVFFKAGGGIKEAELPLITGLEMKSFAPKAGKLYNIKEIIFALDVIKEIKKNTTLKEYQLKKIDVSSLSDASIFLQGEEEPGLLEIKIGELGLRGKFAILCGIIPNLKNELTSIKYIDLRFDTPVVKYKENNVQ